MSNVCEISSDTPEIVFRILCPYSTPGRSQINCQRGIIDGRPAGPQQAFDFLKQSNWAFLSVCIHSRYCGTVQQGENHNLIADRQISENLVFFF